MMSNRKNWIFTFGYGQPNAGHYVKIFGTIGEAREEMMSRFGTKWAFQYSEEEWNEYVEEFKGKVPIEKELK